MIVSGLGVLIALHYNHVVNTNKYKFVHNVVIYCSRYSDMGIFTYEINSKTKRLREINES